MADTIGTLMVKVGMDSTGFQSGITKINQSMAVTKAEFQATTAKLGDFASASDKLKVKADYLTKQADLQRQKVTALKTAYEQAAAGANTDEVALQKLQVKMLQAEKVLANMENSLKKTNQELNNQSSGWQKFGQKMDEIKGKLSNVGSGITNVGKSMATMITAPLVAVGVGCAKLASDLTESTNKVDVAFGNNAKQVEDWSGTTLKNIGVAKGTALDMAATYGDMATSMGLSTGQAADMSTKMVNLAGDLASFKNISIDVANTALNGIFTGETESLKQLGVVMTQANLQEYAYSQGIKTKVQDMSQAEQVQLRYNYVLSMTKNAQGDFARTGAGTANQTRMFEESLKQLGATIGTQLLPVITPVIAKLNEWVQKFGELSPSTQKVILVVGGIAAAIGPVLVVLGSVISAVGTIASVVGAVGPVITGVMAAISSPVLVVVGVIVGLVAAFKHLWETNEEFRNKVKEIWADVKKIIQTVCDWAKAFWAKWGQDIIAVFKSLWDMVKAVFETAVKVIVDIFAAICDILTGDWSGAWTHIKEIFIDLWAGIKDVIFAAWDGLKALGSILYDIGKSIIEGLINGVKAMINKVEQVASDCANAITSKIKGALGIASPSRVMHEVGENVSQGLADGIEDGKPAVDKSVSEVIADLVDMRNQVQAIIDQRNQDLIEAEQECSDNLVSVVQQRDKDILAAEQDLANKLDQINSNMISQEQQVTKAYEQQLDSRINTLQNFVGLFDEVQPKQVSGSELLSNLQGQVDTFTDWQKNLADLQGKGIDAALLDELQQMGPKAAPEIQALNSLTSEELTKYVSLWKQKQEMARIQATAELAKQRQEMNDKLTQIRQDAQIQMEQQRMETAQKIQEIRAKASEELEKYRIEWKNKQDEIRKNALDQAKAIETKWKELEKSATTYGSAIISNLIAGINSQMDNLETAMAGVKSMVGGYMDPTVRHSPSIVDRVQAGVKQIYDTYAGLKTSLQELNLKDSLSTMAPAMAGITNNTTTSSSIVTNQITVQLGAGSTRSQAQDLIRELNRMGVRFSV